MGGDTSDYAYRIAIDGSGNLYTTGFFNRTADFDPGAGVANLTSAGFADIFISKLDTAGNYVWAKSMGATMNDLGQDIAVDGSGNAYATGYFQETVDFDPGVGTANLTSAGINDIFISKLSESVLPLKLLAFTGYNTERGNLLTWVTAAEPQNKGFDIERSTDGIRFEKIGFVPVAGATNNTQSYSFTDKTPIVGVSYYRLKQIDLGGQFEYSKVISIRQEGKNGISVFPNPGKGLFTIKGLTNLETEQLVVTNSIGQTVAVTILQNGQLDLSAYPSGVYYLRVTSTGYVIKLVKE